MTTRGPKDGVTTLRELPRAIEPGRDLWPQIESEISGRGATAPAAQATVSTRRGHGTPLRWLAAAAMVGALAVGVWIGRSVLPGAGPAPLAQAARPAGATLPAAWVSDPRYQRQHEELMRSLGAQLAALPPASRVKVMASLTTIRQAKQQLEEALGKDPGNALLQELLVNTYQDEMRVLTDVREASDAGKGI
ncbi:MAG TPA: hypothetical protein VMT09_12100 [Steroidobacteraceae bacterium]|nr:hypothetical protein [Steroidobacteraceae bacterium]